MYTIRLKINDKVYDKLLRLLNNFSKEEIEIIHEDDFFAENKRYLEKEINDIEKGEANFIEFSSVNKRLEDTIKKHEDSI